MRQADRVVNATPARARDLYGRGDDPVTSSREPPLSYAVAASGSQVLSRAPSSARSGVVVTTTDRTWVSCQLGAREHYAVPRALQLDGLLGTFLTDFWIRPDSLTGRWVQKRGRRFHPALAQARVSAA